MLAIKVVLAGTGPVPTLVFDEVDSGIGGAVAAAVGQRLARLGKPDGTSAYLRLSTRPVDQTLAAVPADPAARERRRRQVVAGGYPLRRTENPKVAIAAMGAAMGWHGAALADGTQQCLDAASAGQTFRDAHQLLLVDHQPVRGLEDLLQIVVGVADRLAAVLGENGMTIVMRLSSFLLVCIGVQILWNGVKALLETLPALGG